MALTLVMPAGILWVAPHSTTLVTRAALAVLDPRLTATSAPRVSAVDARTATSRREGTEAELAVPIIKYPPG